MLRLGIAGMGNAGYAAARNVAGVAGVALAAVADLRREALEPFRDSGTRLFERVEEMCVSQEVDSVWIATPNEFHAQHTIAAASHGKHVILEKPMAVTLAECDRMIAAAEKNGIRLLMHSKVNEPPIAKMREVAASGRLGRVIQISTWNYKGWLDSARLPAELDTTKGGGVLYRQGPHQIDIVRYLAGGMVRSVRGSVGRWNPSFDTEGNFSAFLEFEDGTAATLVFNGYGYFDITELTWDIGEGGGKVSERYKKSERPTGPVDPAVRYAMPLRAETRKRDGDRKQPFYGLTLVSCEKGDIRQSPDGLYIYMPDGRQEILCGPHLDRSQELVKLRDAVSRGAPVFPDGRWGRASLEVALAILQSARERREMHLSYQVAVPQ